MQKDKNIIIKSREIELLKSIPNEISLVYVEAVLMPNGELICNGKTIAWFKNCGHVFRVPQK